MLSFFSDLLDPAQEPPESPKHAANPAMLSAAADCAAAAPQLLPKREGPCLVIQSCPVQHKDLPRISTGQDSTQLAPTEEPLLVNSASTQASSGNSSQNGRKRSSSQYGKKRKRAPQAVRQHRKLSLPKQVFVMGNM
jgi:hypothetical protein